MLKPRRDLGGVQVGIVATAGADDLEGVGVAAFDPAVHEAAPLTPKTRRPAVARLPRGREGHDTSGVCGPAWVTGPTRRSLGQPDMRGVCLNARLQRVRPADPLKPEWDPLIIQIRMITAVAADDLKQAGAAAFAVIHDPGRLPPQGGCPAMPGLASTREWPLGAEAELRARRSPRPA